MCKVLSLPGGNPNHHVDKTKKPQFVDDAGNIWKKFQVTWYDITVDRYMALEFWAMDEDHARHVLKRMASPNSKIEEIERGI